MTELRTLRLLHLCFTMPVLTNGLVGWVVATFRAADFQAPAPTPMLPAVAGLAVLTFLVAPFAGRMLLQRTRDDRPVERRWRAAHLVTILFYETISLYGLMLVFLGAEFAVLVPFAAASLVGLFATFPTEAGFRKACALMGVSTPGRTGVQVLG